MSVVTFSYALLEVKMGKYSRLVVPKNYRETTHIHILPEVGSENIFENPFSRSISENLFKQDISENIFIMNIFSGKIFEIIFSKNIFENLFVEDIS